MLNLEEILDATNKATPEPWKLLTRGNTVKSLAIEGVCGGMKFIDQSDAAFIARSREWVPALCEEDAQLRQENATLIHALQIACGDMDDESCPSDYIQRAQQEPTP